MNRENFSEYIEEPSKLYQLSYQELKSLVLQHPYCANLHVLLLQKAQLDNSTAFSKNLEKAAVHTFDRAYLYDLIKSQKLLSVSREEFAEFEDEILELQDINSLEEKVEKIPLVANENDSSTGITREAAPAEPLSPPVWEKDKEEEEFHLELDIPEILQPTPALPETESVPPPGPADIFVNTSEELTVEEQESGDAQERPQPFLISSSLASTLQSFAPVPTYVRTKIKERAEASLAEQQQEAATEELLAKLQARVQAMRKEVGQAPTIKPPQPKKHFNSWKRQLQPRQLPKPIASPAPAPKRPTIKKAKPSVKVSVIAKQSLEDQGDIASETLAILLVKQEQYPKAIEMYERLKLKNPQKSVYFAGKIEELIKLM
ncbi:MAG: hypothetical protein KTR30_34050 [Saprospiraceae bacterium]|nr:hypothetical protein [Saprospiraceae bacterium]